MKPFVSIIVPFFNAEKTIITTIKSVINQSLTDWELILVDDGSTDDYLINCNEFLRDSRIQLIRQSNQGVSAARNFGAVHAKSRYIVFLDADDSISKTHLADFISESVDDPELVTCEIKIFISNVEKKSNSRKSASYKPSIPGSWMIKRDIFLKLEGFDERLKFAENTEFFFRFDQQKRYLKHIQKENLFYFQSETGGSKNLQNMIDSILIILNKHDQILSTHVKFLYHQIVGVNQLRFQRFDQARKHLWKAYRFKPWNFKTLARLGLSFIPRLSMKIYTKQIS